MQHAACGDVIHNGSFTRYPEGAMTVASPARRHGASVTSRVRPCSGWKG
jgi:hypothetical protein